MELGRRRRKIQERNEDKSVTCTNDDKTDCIGLWTNETFSVAKQKTFLKRKDITEPAKYICLSICHEGLPRC
jgi:hypothetical protein